MSPPLISKAAARYTGAGGKEHCSLCRHFSPRRGGRCARVLGDISPMGWCRLFSREMRGLVADASSFNGGGGGPSLALDFMTPGTLDPRITFTRASTATYFDSAGVMQTAAINTPRWDYNPTTLALRGLLIEEARTNSLVQSADFSLAAWNKQGLAVTRPGTGAPDGTSINLVTEDTSTGPHRIYASTLNTTAAPWTVSVFVKAGTQRYIALRSEGIASGNFPWIVFDTQTQTINANASVTSSGFQALPGGVFRIWLTWAGYVVAGGAVIVAGSNVATAPIPTNGPGPSYTGTSQTWSAWGFQAEAGAFPTSYIATTSAAVTRAADAVSVATAPWLVPATGTVATEFVLFVRSIPDQNLFDMTGSAATVRHRVAGGSGWVIRAAIGAVGFNTANAVTSQLVLMKAALAWGGTTGASVLNGGTVATAAISTDATGTTAMTLGSVAVAGGYLNGWLRQTRYWSRALSNAELQTVTT